MRKSFIAVLLIFLSSAAFGQKKIVFTPHWVAQAQFAGYYVASEKGFYKDAGLDVTILPSTSTQDNYDMLKKDKADVALMSLFQAIRTNDNSIINILQTSQNSSLVIVTQPDITSLKELEGKAVGVWKNGYGLCVKYLFEDLGINVKWVYFLTGINYFTAKAISASSTMYYNEYLQLCNSGKRITDDNKFFLAKMGYDYPEEGLYCRKADFDADPGKYKAFAEATKKGWAYAKDNKNEALGIVYKYMEASHLQINKTTQSWMLEKVIEAQMDTTSGGYPFTLSENSYNQMVDNMKKHGTIKSALPFKEFVNQKNNEDGKN